MSDQAMHPCDERDGGYFCAKSEGHLGPHQSCGGHQWEDTTTACGLHLHPAEREVERLQDKVRQLRAENRQLRHEAAGLTEDGRTVPDLEAEVETADAVSRDLLRDVKRLRAERDRLVEGIRAHRSWVHQRYASGWMCGDTLHQKPNERLWALLDVRP